MLYCALLDQNSSYLWHGNEGSHSFGFPFGHFICVRTLIELLHEKTYNLDWRHNLLKLNDVINWREKILTYGMLIGMCTSACNLHIFERILSI